MAFDQTNLYHVTGSPGFGLYVYKPDGETIADVGADGYINNIDDLQNFAVDDTIQVIGSQGSYGLRVASISDGAITTEVSSDFPSGVINVKNYGAVGDGVTDDTAAIQAAIDALPDSGGTVALLAGTYAITPPITIDVAKSISIRGMGRSATTIKAIGAYGVNEAMFRVGENTKVTFLEFSDLTMDGLIASQAGDNRWGVRGYKASQISFKSVRFTNMKGSSINTTSTNDVDYIGIRNCEFDNDGAAEASVFTFNTGMVVIDKCWFHDIWKRGCWIKEDDLNDLTDAVSSAVITNSLWQNLGVSGNLGRLEVMVANGALVANNTLMDSPGHINNNLYLCKGNEVCINNTVINMGGGIVFNHFAGVTNVGGSILMGNTVIDSGAQGIFNSGVNGCIIANNIIRTSQKNGIDLRANDCTVMGNICEANGQNTSNISGILIDRETGQGAERNIITDNLIFDNQSVPTQTIGIREVEGGAETVDNNEIYNNRLGVGITTPYLSSGGAGANTKIHNNSGIVTENSGTGTIADMATSVVITHGLDLTPALKDISVVLGESPTNDPGNIWVDTIGATQFTINCRNDPGASNLDLAWQVIRLG